MIKEEEYNVVKKVYSAKSPQEAMSVLMDVRARYGFSEYDSWVDGTDVFVSIEKDNTNDGYLSDVDNAVSGYAANRKIVAEKNVIRLNESKLRDIVGEVLMRAMLR